MPAEKLKKLEAEVAQIEEENKELVAQVKALSTGMFLSGFGTSISHEQMRKVPYVPE